MNNEKYYLNVGSGDSGEEIVYPLFRGPEWKGFRVDLDAECKPDIIADMVTLNVPLPTPDGLVDGIYSSHSLEHLHAHDAIRALLRWREVLRTGGRVILRLPDIEAATQAVADGKPLAPMYVAGNGHTITALDMIYGLRAFTDGKAPMMRHAWGYTQATLTRALLDTGYTSVNVVRDRASFELFAFATK